MDQLLNGFRYTTYIRVRFRFSRTVIVLLPAVSTFHFLYVGATPTPMDSALRARADPPLGTIHLPAPTGPYTIGTTNLILTDHTRLEIFSPTPNTTARTIIGQIYYPTLPFDKLNKSGSYTLSPYVTPGLARRAEQVYGLPPHTTDGILTNTYMNAPVSLPRRGDSADIVIFSPGYGMTRSTYANYQEQLASMGYIVVAIEHLYDVVYVDIPGLGEFVNPYANTTEAVIEEMQAVRVQDALFILRSLADPQSQLVTGVERLFATSNSGDDNKDTWWSKHARVAMYGHSLGGSTAAGAMLFDNTSVKLLGGINLDGTFRVPNSNLPTPAQSYLDSPFLLFGAQLHNRTTDATWALFYDNTLRGWKRELALLEAKHTTFSDLAPIVDLFGLRKLLPPDVVDGTLGTIPGLRAAQIVREFVVAFMDWVIKGDKDGMKLLDGEGMEQWSEVQYLW